MSVVSYPDVIIPPLGLWERFGGVALSLVDDNVDAFVLGSSGAKSLRNQQKADGFGRGGDASIVGAPTYDPLFATLNGSNYLLTQASERFQFTILTAVRIRASGSNKTVTLADNYALDPAVDAGVDAGATKIGIYFTMSQALLAEPPGTLSIRVGIGKPDPTTPLISFMNPTLAISDVWAWRLVAAVCYGVSSRLYDLTAGTQSAIANAPAGYRRIPSSTNKYRIGSDRAAFANGSADFKAWQHYDRALTDAELAVEAGKLRTDFAKQGIAL